MAKRASNLHWRAKVPFHLVERARDMKEHHGYMVKEIMRELREQHGFDVSINTMNDWLYYRTRINS